MDSSRMIRLRVRPPDRRTSRMIDGVIYSGGEEGDVEQLEALTKLASGNFDLAAGEKLTDHESRFLAALSDPMWPRQHGRYPTFQEFA